MCGIRCGLEVKVENNRIVKVRPDKDSPVSEGYVCRKGMNVAYHDHNADRVLYPLKRVGDRFERISWDQAIGEIAEKLKKILQAHGPRSLASVAGGGEFSFYPARFLDGFIQALGSRYHYSAANQEFAGRYWAHGLTFGSQRLELIPDYENTEMLMTVGWNGMMSHQIPQARRVLTGISKDPDKLLVATEIAMSETAMLAHYVLPCRSTHESWSPADAIIPSKTREGFLDVVSRMCRPMVEVEGEQKEAGEIYTLLADAMGLIPSLPDSLYKAAGSGDLKTYRDALIGYVMEHPENTMTAPFIAAKTLGKAIGSAHLAGYFIGLSRRSRAKQEEAAGVGFDVGPDQGMALYQAVIDHPEGVLVGIQDIRKNLGRVAAKDGRIRLYTAEVEEWIKEISPGEEEKRLNVDAEFPLILMAGRHMDMNANTGMRNPAWNEGRRPCTLAMNSADAVKYGFSDGQMVKVITEAGEESIEVQVTEDARKGQVIIPHGFGLVYDGVKYGANVNRLTKNTNRDFVGTPMHRYVPCRVEAA